MVASRKKLFQPKHWYKELINPALWEAPDRNFPGHRDILTRSLARYHFICSHLHDLTLEVGCGRGYGFEIIGPRSTTSIGIDISWAYLGETQQRLSNISLVQASGDALPFIDHVFDSIVAFEVIEHIQDNQAFLNDLRRVARTGAFIAISTPNKLIVSGLRQKPLDPFHTREYTAAEFRALLNRFFSIVVLYGQHEVSKNPALSNWLIDRIPLRWKYFLPVSIQGRLSVALRPPLQLGECQFRTEDLDGTHTFVALCHP